MFVNDVFFGQRYILPNFGLRHLEIVQDIKPDLNQELIQIECAQPDC